MKSEKLDFFVSCAPGLEGILTAECKSLGLTPLPAVPIREDKSLAHEEDKGGLLLRGDTHDLYRCNLHLRTASRVSVRFGDFFASAFSELRKKAARLPWEKFILPGAVVKLSVTCHRSKLYHSDAVAERVLGAINDHFSSIPGNKLPVTAAKQGQLVQVRLVNDQCTISLDSSGDLLHKRGYRLATAKAPLRETLAAGLLLGFNWDPSLPLIDPFCGSGTIPIEAALLSESIPPGLAREFAFKQWPDFQSQLWEGIIEESRQKIHRTDSPIFGFDRDNGAVQMAQANAARAGQYKRIVFEQQAISSLVSPAPKGWIITNPPYGKRVSNDKDLRDLYARFGDVLKERFPGWKAGILCSDKRMIGNLKIGEPELSCRFINGGIPVTYNVYSI